MLIDEIRAKGVEYPPDFGNIMGNFFKVIHDCTVIEASNVRRYIASTSTGKVENLADRVPNGRLPFPAAFIEAGFIRDRRNEVSGRDGHLMQIYEWKDQASIITPSLKEQVVEAEKAEPAYILTAIYVCKFDVYPKVIALGASVCFLRGDGSFWEKALTTPARANLAPAHFRQIISQLKTEIFVPGLAIAFMHCKNVRRVENIPNEALQKARARKGKPPLSHYYTLEIEPMKEVLRTEGRIKEVGLKKALHICRGHFATYSEEKPLFGKKSGTFWIPAHTRGSADQGTIRKDYKINV